MSIVSTVVAALLDEGNDGGTALPDKLLDTSSRFRFL
jgi:hypothetical protein